MRVGQRFCGGCGVDLKPGARFCAACGRPVPSLDGPTLTQGPSGGGPPAQDLPPRDLPPPEAPFEEDPLPPGPPPPVPPFSPGPPSVGSPPRQRSRPGYLIPLIAALAVLVAGGSVGAVVLIRHFTGHPVVQNTPAAISPTTASPVSSGPDSGSASPSTPPTPPSQVTIGGMAIGISAVNTDPDATAVADTLAAYFGAIDNRNYRKAWDTYSAGEQAVVPYGAFANQLSTTQDTQVTVQSIQHDDGGNLEADISFQSQQAGQDGPSPGETCTDWTLDYHLVPTTAVTSGAVPISYRIDKVTYIGPGHTAC
jgi:eukaryotic-like serine/threonine-protein kinase